MKTRPEEIADSWRRERPDLAGSGLMLTVRLRAMGIMIDHELARIAAAEAIHSDDLLLLFAMRRVGPPYCLRPTDVSALLNITSGAATYRVERLVRANLSHRIKDPRDGRSYVMQISQHGMDVIDRCVDALAQVSDMALKAADISESNMKSLTDVLHMVERGWESVIPPEENPLRRGSTPASQNHLWNGKSPHVEE